MPQELKEKKQKRIEEIKEHREKKIREKEMNERNRERERRICRERNVEIKIGKDVRCKRQRKENYIMSLSLSDSKVSKTDGTVCPKCGMAYSDD